MDPKEAYKKELEAYVEKNLKLGFSIEDIREKLKGSNIEENIIDDVISSSKNGPKSKTTEIIVIISVILILISVTFYFIIYPRIYLSGLNIEKFNHNGQEFKILTLDTFPKCMNPEENDFGRYICYKEKSEKVLGAHPCGLYFIGYEEEKEEYEQKISPGEIILFIDDEHVKTDSLRTETFLNLFSKKNIGDNSNILTNKDQYTYPYLDAPNWAKERFSYSGAYLYIDCQLAYCIN